MKWSFRVPKRVFDIYSDDGRACFAMTPNFGRFQRREGITDRMLGKAIGNAERGLVDAGLGGGLIKQRTARPGQGKSGGYRTIIAYRRGDRAVFLFGFAKSERANLDDDELSYFAADRAKLSLA